jgi:hypothetical protein
MSHVHAEAEQDTTEDVSQSTANPIPDSTGITSEQAEQLLLEHGRNEIEEKEIPKW